MKKENKVFISFDANDYLVRLTPFIDKKGNWTGEILVGTVTTDENNMSDEDHFNLMTITKMVCAAVPAMEEDEYVRDTLNEIVDKTEEEEENALPKDKIDSIKENVISVNFNQ
jgi:heat shock protein HslJ|tara:strand:- start:276 stop:614 length:339 start_codon:yes stop_codon:yes gene_type:complete